MHLDNTTVERFWQYVNTVDDDDSCWEWQASKTDWGYGRLYAGGEGRVVRAHRIAYELEYGPIPEGMIVLHTCDNPACCRPSHLRTGTYADNTHDMMQKGRNPRGENHRNSILTWSKVREIRERVAAGETQRKLAEEFNVSPATITHIKHGDTWRE